MNKKMVFAALFCGFVLSDGYCFDEEHKITQEYLNRSFNELREIQDKADTMYYVIRKNVKNDECMSEFWKLCNKVFLEIRKLIRYNLQDFGKEVLLSKIPSGKHKGKQVKDLLMKNELDCDTMMTICDDSVKFLISDDYGTTAINFELKNGKNGIIKLYPGRVRITFIINETFQQYFGDVDIEI